MRIDAAAEAPLFISGTAANVAAADRDVAERRPGGVDQFGNCFRWVGAVGVHDDTDFASGFLQAFDHCGGEIRVRRDA